MISVVEFESLLSGNGLETVANSILTRQRFASRPVYPFQVVFSSQIRIASMASKAGRSMTAKAGRSLTIWNNGKTLRKPVRPLPRVGIHSKGTTIPTKTNRFSQFKKRPIFMKKLANSVFLSLSVAAGVAVLSGCGTNDQTADKGVTTKATQESGSETKSVEPSVPQTTLATQLEDQIAKSAAKFPAPLLEKFKAGIDTVRQAGIEDSAKQVGDAAVDGELIGWNGEAVRLSDVWSEGPVILMWYRGGWCPYCNIQLRAMQKSLDEIESAGARLVVLTPELPEKAKETAETAGIDIVALHDRDNRLAEKYGIMFDLPEAIVPTYRDKLKLPSFNGSDKMQLPLAATYVINTSGEITYAFLDADYKKRAEPSEVIKAVIAVAK